MKTFFISGNKRSGSTFLVKLLNLHPQLFITHESDIIWILYHFHKDIPLVPYPYDSPPGMEFTLNKYGHLLDKNKTPIENYVTIQRCALRDGRTNVFPPMEKPNLLWIGDKKPFQYADPVLVQYISDIFPVCKFIHLVRHPFAVARSAKDFGSYIWDKMSLVDIVERWTMHEKQVLELKMKFPASFIDVRYEDLCRNIEKELTRIFLFLDVYYDDILLKETKNILRFEPKHTPIIPCSEETVSIMSRYEYQPVEHYNP